MTNPSPHTTPRKHWSRKLRKRGLPFVATLVGVVGMALGPAHAGDEELALPADFRGEMLHLGSWYVPSGEASGFHDVYADADAVKAFRKTGNWPDGAKIVKELRASEAGTYTTGAGVLRATNTIKQWFVMVKDADNSNQGPLWGDGWGWALYKPDARHKNVATNYKTDCLGCHLPAREKDLVYLEAYPTLKR